MSRSLVDLAPIRSRRLRSLLAASFATILVAGPSLAATPSISIGSVDGQAVSGGAVKNPVSGTVTVEGTSAPTGGGGGEATRPLVADAGDSPFVTSGQRAMLLGAAWGGTRPYSFQWSTPVGSFAQGGDGPSA